MRREEARKNKYSPNTSKNVSVEETVDEKSTMKTKAYEVIEEVFLNCDICGENSKTEQHL